MTFTDAIKRLREAVIETPFPDEANELARRTPKTEPYIIRNIPQSNKSYLVFVNKDGGLSWWSWARDDSDPEFCGDVEASLDKISKGNTWEMFSWYLVAGPLIVTNWILEQR